ncbi:hypothetical protein SFRURICE_010677 [Spodoptera frugiperda]|nr:hypothetical protein SFRURICE_010677 [Spodoptera frugiperda]
MYNFKTLPHTGFFFCIVGAFTNIQVQVQELLRAGIEPAKHCLAVGWPATSPTVQDFVSSLILALGKTINIISSRLLSPKVQAEVTLRHVMPLYIIHPVFIICVIKSHGTILLLRNFLKIEKCPVILCPNWELNLRLLVRQAHLRPRDQRGS